MIKGNYLLFMAKVWILCLPSVCRCFPLRAFVFCFTSAHVLLHERTCFASRALVNSKKVYTFFAFGVHLFWISCTPFCGKVYTFLYYRMLVRQFTSARVTVYDRTLGCLLFYNHFNTEKVFIYLFDKPFHRVCRWHMERTLSASVRMALLNSVMPSAFSVNGIIKHFCEMW